MSQLSNTVHSATLTVKAVMVQPTTVASNEPAPVWTTATATAAEKTPELSGVWCPLLMTVANNTFCNNNKKKPFPFDENSRVLYKPQIHYNNAYINENNNNNNKDKNNNKALRIYQQQHLYHCQPQPYNTIQHSCSGYQSSCYCCYCPTKSRLCITTTINPQIAEHIKDSNNLKVAYEMDTKKNLNAVSLAQNSSSSLMSPHTKTSINFLLFLIITHESHHFLILTEECCPSKKSFVLENSNAMVLCRCSKNEEMRCGSIKTTNVTRERIKTLVLLEGVLIGNTVESFSTMAWKCQMLMKWFISSLQNNCNHLSEQDISMLTLQYCNNLINVGVLKQISEKNDLETFKPFQMYQWTHTEAPTTSQPLTPGKLDKVTSWPYCSTPTSGVSRIPKAIQVDTPHTGRDNGFLQVLRKRLLSCSTIAEVHTVINDMLSAGEPLRRPSKRSILLTDLLNASEATVYQYDKNLTGTSSGCESGIQDAGVQTEVSQAIVKFVCSKCKDTNIEPNQYGTMKCDKEIQVSWSEVGGDTLLDSKKLTLATSESMPPSPFPPPPPSLAASIVAPPPPPPPPPLLLPPPPPPPPPSCVGPPPPPPPSSSSATNTLALNTSTVPPPPPPCAIKTPSTTTPAPLPNPAEGGWFNQANTLRKTAVNPPKPMKPLYWTRIVTQPPPPKPIKAIAETSTTGDITDSSSPGTSPDDPVSSESPSVPKEIWQEIDETCLDNIDEFTELFSREAVVPKVVPKIKKEVRARPIKVLDSKRSQNVGILLRSSHVDFCEIEHAIYHVDTSVVSLETLQQINKNKATNEELERIKEQGDTPLDEPEQFLLKISQISMFTERISCMVFMAEFEETATLIERKLEVVMQLSQFLMESEELKLIFAIILTLGNYMNGGNRQRGQADGFTLEILSKLKDVKSKDSQTTLLHFIVRTYIGRKRKEGVQLLEIPLPIPEPSDVERATQVDFDEVKGQITKLNDQLNAKKRTTDKVIIHSTTENLEPFKSKMEEFIKNASKEVDKLYKELEDCREVFIETMKFYHYAPKSGTLEQCTPNKFFEHWTNFTNDFKDIMKKEIAILWNELLRKTKDVQTRKTVKTTKVKPGGLKERIMRLNKK